LSNVATGTPPEDNHDSSKFNGKPIGQVNTEAWRKALKRAGIADFRWHDLRHTWTSWHVQAGTSLHVLQELGGWSDFKMVQRYAHMAPEHLSRFEKNPKHAATTSQARLKIV
jgi:integrase